MIGSVSLSLISMAGVMWTAYQANRAVNLVEREIAHFQQTVYHPFESAAEALGKQIDEKFQSYFEEKPTPNNK